MIESVEFFLNSPLSSKQPFPAINIKNTHVCKSPACRPLTAIHAPATS